MDASLLELVGGSVVAMVALARMIGTLRRHRRAADSKKWRRYEAEITTSELVPYRVRMSGEGWGTRIWRPVIQYRYTVDGRQYTSGRIYYGDPLGMPWRGPLEKLIRRYPVGTTTSVYVPSEDPQLALLEPGARIDVYAAIVGFGAMLVIGVALLLGFWT